MYWSTEEKLLMRNRDKAEAQPLLICFSPGAGQPGVAVFFQKYFLFFSNQYLRLTCSDSLGLIFYWLGPENPTGQI